MTFEFKKLADTLFIPLKNETKISLNFECETKTGVIESYKNLIIYLELTDDDKKKITQIEEEITKHFEGDFKHSILTNSNVGIYKLLKKKDKLCAEIKTKGDKNKVYTSIKSKQIYNVELVLDYVWNRNDKYGFTWSIHKMQVV